MASGTTGRVVGWGVTEDNVSSSVLKVVDLEAVDHRTCKERAEKSFLPYILPDKFCATRANENVCQVIKGFEFIITYLLISIIVLHRETVAVGSRRHEHMVIRLGTICGVWSVLDRRWARSSVRLYGRTQHLLMFCTTILSSISTFKCNMLLINN